MHKFNACLFAFMSDLRKITKWGLAMTTQRCITYVAVGLLLLSWSGISVNGQCDYRTCTNDVWEFEECFHDEFPPTSCSSTEGFLNTHHYIHCNGSGSNCPWQWNYNLPEQEQITCGFPEGDCAQPMDLTPHTWNPGSCAYRGFDYACLVTPLYWANCSAPSGAGYRPVCPQFDGDEDGYVSEQWGGDDCDDTDPDVNPGAYEICGNNKDDDCDGWTDVVYCPEGYEQPWGCNCWPSPIILELNNRPYHLTDAQRGVNFDLNVDGSPERVAWTQPGTDAAFLAYDVNLNGRIDDGSELLGDHTRLIGRYSFKNGFEVLRYFDTPAMGGNFDGVIDHSDYMYPRLLLWRDDNHDGVSQPNEVLRFADHFFSIDWTYVESTKRDGRGNLFRWRSVAHNKNGHVRYVYDVILSQLTQR